MALLHTDKGTLQQFGRAYSIEILLYEDKIIINKKLKILGGGFGLVGMTARAIAKASGKGDETITLNYSDILSVEEGRKGLKKVLKISFRNPNDGSIEKWDIFGLKNRQKIITIINNIKG